MKVVVTGGTGFLGREVACQLSERGHRVTSLSRGLINPGGLAEGVAFTRSDIHDDAALTQVFSGADAVVHCAALSSPWGKRKAFVYENVDGTKSVVGAAERAGVRRFIHISSSSVYFEFADRIGIREGDALPRPANFYAESKQLAEIAARAFTRETFILRPRGIFGKGDPHLLPRLLRVMRHRTLPLLRGGEALVDLTDVRVVADAVCTAMDAPASAGGTYNVSQGDPITIKDLIETVGRAIHITPRWRSLPVQPAILAARLLELAAKLDPKRREPPVTAYSLGLFAFSQTLDLSAARHLLHWQPRRSLRESLDHCLQDHKDAL